MELENKSSPKTYAKTVQKKLAAQMNLVYLEATAEDIFKWKEGKLCTYQCEPLHGDLQTFFNNPHP